MSLGLRQFPAQTASLVAMYLGAIVAANLTVAWLGPAVTPLTAFAFIGLDLVSRDGLHDRWHGRGLWPKMLGLIVAGSALSWALSGAAGRIALASLVAFAGAGVVDAAGYHLLRRRARLVRMNGSNVPAALVDSLLFPALAFGAWLPWVVLGQFVAKVGGGFVWSLLLRRVRV